MRGKSFQRRAEEYYQDHLAIDPRSSLWVLGWEVTVVVVTIVVAFHAPFASAFSWEEGLTLFDHFVYLFFLADIALQFFLAMPDPDRPSCVVRTPSVVIGKYVAGWFLVDACAVAPYPVQFVLSPGRLSGNWHLRSVVHHLGLCRMVKLPRIGDRLSITRRLQIFFGFSFAALEVLKYLLLGSLACHWMACVWGGIGLGSSDTWLKKLAETKGQPYSMYEESTAMVYSVCLYWAIMTLTSVGYGDVCPHTMKEYLVACLCMGLSGCLWAYIIGEVCRIAASIDPHETRFMQTMDDLNYLMKSRSMPRSMRMSMRTYLYESRELSRQNAQHPVLDQMSPMLQGQMAMQLHQGWLEKVWYLREIEGQALVNIARRLQADFFAPNEEVAAVQTLFIVRRGICIRRSKILLKGDVWGEDMVLANHALRDDSPCKAISYLEVLMLNNADLALAVKAFPQVVAQIQKVKVKIAVMRGIVLVARAIKELMYTEEWDRDEISMEHEQYIVQKVLSGEVDNGMMRPSHFKMGRTRTRRVRISQASVSSWKNVNEPPSSDMQAVMQAISNLEVKLDAMAPERRASRVDRSKLLERGSTMGARSWSGIPEGFQLRDEQ